MTAGRLVAIFVGPERCGPMRGVTSARAVAGQGLEGDRYFRDPERPSKSDGPDREVTLIEAEAIEAVNRDENLPLDPSETRRNLVTRGVALNHLVGREFQVGGVRLRGVRLCEPCKHLQQMTRPGMLNALLHRGGLRAEVLAGGEFQVDDPVETATVG